MKKFWLCFALAAVAAVTAMAQEEEAEVAVDEGSGWTPSASLTLEYGSRYMSDGNILNPKSMIFGALDLGLESADGYGFYAGIWGAYDQNNFNADSKIYHDFEEIDYYFGAWYAIGDATIDLGYTYWDMPKRTGWNGVGCTQQKLNLDVNYKIVPVEEFTLKPGVLVNWDFENGEWQVKPYVKTSYTITEKLTLNNSIELFWQNSAWTAGRAYRRAFKPTGHEGIYRNGFTTLVFGGDLSYAITKNVSFGPFGKLAYAVNHTYREAWKAAGNPNSASGWNTLWGVRLNVSF